MLIGSRICSVYLSKSLIRTFWELPYNPVLYYLWVAPISTPAFAVSEATWKFPSLCYALPRHTENRHP